MLAQTHYYNLVIIKKQLPEVVKNTTNISNDDVMITDDQSTYLALLEVAAIWLFLSLTTYLTKMVRCEGYKVIWGFPVSLSQIYLLRVKNIEHSTQTTSQKLSP